MKKQFVSVTGFGALANMGWVPLINPNPPSQKELPSVEELTESPFTSQMRRGSSSQSRRKGRTDGYSKGLL